VHVTVSVSSSLTRIMPELVGVLVPKVELPSVSVMADKEQPTLRQFTSVTVRLGSPIPGS
jgi:hypothetical protein